jgi:hypothetical protein
VSAPVMNLAKKLFLTGVLLSVVVLGGGLGFALGNNPLLSFMLLGTFIVHMGSGPKSSERLWTVGAAVFFRTIYAFTKGFHPYFGSAVVSWGGFLGVASLIVLLFQTARSTGERRSNRLRTFATAGALPYTWVIVAFSLGTITHTSQSLDANLLAFDASLGAPFSFILGQVLASNPLLAKCTWLIYNALPLGGASMLAWYNRAQHRPVRIIHLYLSVMVMGFFVYGLFPAAGPLYAYAGKFPWNAPDKWSILSHALTSFDAPRNAMPSLHFGAMLVLLWNSRAWPWWGRVAAFAFTLGIAFSTLALGEHYLIDLVVAFPFMLGMQAAWSTGVPWNAPCRKQAMIAGFAGTAGWFVALRWGIPAFLSFSALGWIALAVTVAGSVWLEQRLANALWQRQQSTAPQVSEVLCAQF